MNEKNRIYVNASQIRAARALLDWSQEDLASATGLSIATIRKIETGHISPRDKTMDAIIEALGHAKIQFLPPMGVSLRTNDIVLIESDDSYSDLMDDLYNTLKDKGGEALFMYADNALTSEAQIENQLRSRHRGIKFRFLIEESNSYMHYPLEEYRWIPKRLFNNNLQVIYGNKVAVCIYRGMEFGKVTKVVVIDSAALAGSLKNTFEFMWENCRKPTFTTAPKIYA